jgi:hypothetical protein
VRKQSLIFACGELLPLVERGCGLSTKVDGKQAWSIEFGMYALFYEKEQKSPFF